MRPADPAQIIAPSVGLRTLERDSSMAAPYAERRTQLAVWRDALAGTLLLVALIALGSGGLASFDVALLGYLGATLVSTFGVLWKVSAFWRRPATAFYGRALLGALRAPRSLLHTAASAGSDLVAQNFVRRRSPLRWLAHLLLSGGTLLSFAITLPLVFGWTYFVAGGERHYRMVVFTLPAMRFDVAGLLGWMLFHALSLAAIGVLAGAAYFLLWRVRHRRRPGATSAFAMAPLLLLLVVAASGLALPASRHSPAAFRAAAWIHELSVIVLLVALPFSKLWHLFLRPLQLGVRAVRREPSAWQGCARCGERLAPAAQQQAVVVMLAQRSLPGGGVSLCAGCRRRRTARAQAAAIGARFQPSWRGSSPEGL
jgi:hypothetical protein